MAATIVLLKYLDFTIHEAKSILKPTQRIEFLGFITDSTKMTVTIRKDKMSTITNKIRKLMTTTFLTIRQLASVRGFVISLFPAVPLGKLHYRALEKGKAVALKNASGNFDKIVANISVKAIDELNWWLTEIPHARRNMYLLDIDFTSHTDTSEIGWE